MYFGTMPNGVNSPCGLVTVTTRADAGPEFVGHVLAEHDGGQRLSWRRRVGRRRLWTAARPGRRLLKSRQPSP